MALTKKEYRIINLSKLSKVTGIDYMKLYNNITGEYEVCTLDIHEKTTICNALNEELIPLLEFFGFKVEVKRIK